MLKNVNSTNKHNSATQLSSILSSTAAMWLKTRRKEAAVTRLIHLQLFQQTERWRSETSLLWSLTPSFGSDHRIPDLCSFNTLPGLSPGFQISVCTPKKIRTDYFSNKKSRDGRSTQTPMHKKIWFTLLEPRCACFKTVAPLRKWFFLGINLNESLIKKTLFFYWNTIKLDAVGAELFHMCLINKVLAEMNLCVD